MQMQASKLTGFKKTLFDAGLIPEETIQETWNYARQHDESFVKCLIEKDKLDETKLASLVSKFFNMPLFSINSYDYDGMFDITPYKAFLKTTNDVFPLYERGEKLYVAVYTATTPSRKCGLKRYAPWSPAHLKRPHGQCCV